MSAGTSRVDIGAIARAALGSAESLLRRWLPSGRRQGHEWIAGNLRGDAGDSLSVNLNSGLWADFAADARGGDLVSLYAAIFNVNNLEAAREMARELGIAIDLQSPAAKARPETDAKGSSVEPGEDHWSDAGAVPADGPAAPVAHTHRGRPHARWAYVDEAGQVLGYVCRFVTSAGGKEVIPLTWSRHPAKGVGWRWRQFDDPRPLFNMQALASQPQARVLVVEGEKCAEAAQAVLGDAWVVTTWPGGCKAWNKARWDLLKGRPVLIWPDADAKKDKDGTLLPEARQPGVRAAEQIAQRLGALGAASIELVAVPAPGAVKDGWDIADAIEEAASGAAAVVAEWLTKRRPPSFSVVGAAGGGMPPNRDGAPQGSGEGGSPDDWRRQLLHKRGELALCTANIALILRNDERWQGVIAYDEFGQVTLKRERPPYAFGRTGEWEAEDDSRTAMWLAQRYGLTVTSAMVTEAVETVAREQRFHPVVDYLRSLRWDGVPRNAKWLATYCRVQQSDYAALMGVLFLRGMVKRVLQPGCKFDYCLVLEGAEGLRKSTLAATLGGEWGSDTPLDLGNNREASAALHGRWVMEFSEMESVTRAEAHLQKSFLSRTFDQYRPVYSRRNIKVPRQCVFIGTTNETEYIKEGQGARRFWPAAVEGPIDIDGLRRILPQLLAEALYEVDSGERCYPTEEEQAELFREQQMRRVVQESLIDALHDWVLEPTGDEQQARAAHGGAFSLADAAFRCLKISYAQLTRDLQTRVGKALASLGCERQEKRNGMTRYWYKPPQKAARSGAVRRVQQPDDGTEVPF
ncbi:MAG TPA: VapE family protein [Burkholderiaceae bacterium]|nr:VapE family protein [Burkholderiaceae bacterium]